ncbi:hypothetical protein BJ508DRAFT_47700 [Ascobolus immersus RN42]|uniref:Uncharacterized protein n=1 Tax=Ascobolus immersus RN42 TaxID=1160509 RepID=A0A3N4IE71_ASCIM|nr:hypothetical protein BJ508DRAFT_47700 [Ascobolus immersus RN42]
MRAQKRSFYQLSDRNRDLQIDMGRLQRERTELQKHLKDMDHRLERDGPLDLKELSGDSQLLSRMKSELHKAWDEVANLQRKPHEKQA